MHLFKTCWVGSIFKERKLKGEMHSLIQHLMGEIYFVGEKIERRTSRIDSGLVGPNLFLRREN